MRIQGAALIGALAVLSACTNNSPIGVVDVGRIVNNWPKYQQVQTQIAIREQAIELSKEPNQQKARDAAGLQAASAKALAGLTQEIRGAASKIATNRNLKLVVTHEGVGYGGVDITPDVEKALNITEKATPTP